MAVVRDLRTLLRFANFRRLLAVRLLSQGADGVYQVALAAYVVFSPEKQTSPAAIASAMAVLLLPYSLVGPFAGVLLDRWRRRQVFLYGNLLRAVMASTTAVLILGHVPDWLFYASALSVTAVNRFVLAGLSAALPRVVDAERLVMANSSPRPPARSPRPPAAASPSSYGWSCPTPTPPWCCSAPSCTCARDSRRSASRPNNWGRTPSWCAPSWQRRSPAPPATSRQPFATSPHPHAERPPGRSSR